MQKKQPNKREAVKRSHERFAVESALTYYNQANGTNFVYENAPEPPDAIAKDGSQVLWLEVVDAASKEILHDEYSYATEGEEHVPAPSRNYAQFDPDGKMLPLPVDLEQSFEPDLGFVADVLPTLRQKLQKTNYQPLYEQHGKGVLIVSIFYPLFDDGALKKIRRLFHEKVEGDLGYFGTIYIYDTGDATIHVLRDDLRNENS